MKIPCCRQRLSYFITFDTSSDLWYIEKQFIKLELRRKYLKNWNLIVLPTKWYLNYLIYSYFYISITKHSFISSSIHLHICKYICFIGLIIFSPCIKYMQYKEFIVFDESARWKSKIEYCIACSAFLPQLIHLTSSQHLQLWIILLNSDMWS